LLLLLSGGEGVTTNKDFYHYYNVGINRFVKNKQKEPQKGLMTLFLK
jgi:hypothetical protein